MLLAGSALLAQSVDAAVSGIVSDPTGAAVPAATVTALNIKTGVAVTAQTNEAGVYNFAALPAGVYRFTAERDGFRKFVLNDATLEVGARLSINIPLELGSLAEVIEVSAESEMALGYVTSSVGGMITGRKVLDLPLTSRNALGLVLLQAGVVGDNFSGSRIGNLNVQMDGVNVMDARINLGVDSVIFPSTDRVEEFRVVTSPVDAEFGRGSGQVQLITRSGSNEYRGSLFNFHRNTVFNANTWFNNQRGLDPVTGSPVSPREILIRNQYGARIGGPIVKNKTFFHVLYEGQKIRRSETVNTTVWTQTARQGIYRFFPNVQNGNALASTPTVDRNGNPVSPTGAALQSVNLLTLDPNRRGMDATGTVAKYISQLPLPNNFLSGDGLNTAGYTWNRARPFDQWQLAVKIDHNFSTNHRLAFSANSERSDEPNGFLAQPFPGVQGGITRQRDYLYSLTLTSAISPALVNEFRAGVLRPTFRFYAPWELGGSGVLPAAGGTPYGLDFVTITDPINISNDPQGRISPNYQYFNKVSWTRGTHNIKFGGQLWYVSTNGFNSFDVLPRAVIGAGAVPVQGVVGVAGIGQNQAGAQNILNDLNGSLASLR
jgi:hypothetical protein